MKDLIQIEHDIKGLKLLRNNQRQKALKEIALNLHHTLKQFGYITIERKFLKTFFDDDISLTSQNEILKEILTYLISKNLMRITTTEKTYNTLRIKPLMSYINKNNESITISNKSIIRENQKQNIMVYKLL